VILWSTGNEIMELVTAGEAVALKIACDREIIAADGQDLSYLTVEGRCIAVVKSGEKAGEITVTATALGMQAAFATIRSQ
jgi:hypothetical protein